MTNQQTFGNIALRDAVLQVRATVGVARLDHLAVLDMSGPDAVSFLQNRLSNDVKTLQPGAGQVNAALDRQGKIQGVFDLYRTAAGFQMIISEAEKAHCLAQIEKFHIVEQFTLREMTDSVIISLQGPQSEFLLNTVLPEPMELPVQEQDWIGTTLFTVPVWLIRRSYTGETGFLMMVQTLHADSIYRQLQEMVSKAQGVEMSPDVQEVLRIEAGLPQYGSDYDFETLLPETGLERLAVSYSKGCYLGQETIARIKTYGMVQKALVGLLFEPHLTEMDLPPLGSLCELAGKTVGHLKSRVYSPTLNRGIALAYLGKTERIPGKRLNLDIAGNSYTVEVVFLPFYDTKDQQKSGQSLLDEGLKLFAEGFEQEAIRVLRLAIEADPQLLNAYEALGVILSRQERFEEAISLMNQVLLLEPDHVLAHTNLSVFYMKLGDKEKAEEEKAKATMAAFSKKARESGLVVDLEAERLKKEQVTLAKIAMFQEALSFSPADPLGNFGLGTALLELKRYDEAIEPFEKTLKAQPKYSVAYLSLGKALEGANQHQKAKEIYQKGIDIAAAKGDLMPLKEMQARLESLRVLVKD